MEGTIFITAAEMAEILGISKPYAYKIIKQMNEDLEANGFITISGKVNLYGIAYFCKMIDKSRGEKYLQELDKIEWFY